MPLIASDLESRLESEIDGASEISCQILHSVAQNSGWAIRPLRALPEGIVTLGESRRRVGAPSAVRLTQEP
jgi:hypothetical protein